MATDSRACLNLLFSVAVITTSGRPLLLFLTLVFQNMNSKYDEDDDDDGGAVVHICACFIFVLCYIVFLLEVGSREMYIGEIV